MGNKAEVLKVVEDYINSAYESDGATMRKIFDDDAMVTELLWIEGAVVLWIVAHTSTEGSNHGLNLVVLEDFRDVALLALDVQDLAAEGQNGLNATVAARLG